MNINRNLAKERKEELEGILMDRIRELHHTRTDEYVCEAEIIRELCELGRVLVMSLTSSADGDKKACDSHNEARYRCDRVNCRLRK